MCCETLICSNYFDLGQVKYKDHISGPVEKLGLPGQVLVIMLSLPPLFIEKWLFHQNKASVKQTVLSLETLTWRLASWSWLLISRLTPRLANDSQSTPERNTIQSRSPWRLSDCSWSPRHKFNPLEETWPKKTWFLMAGSIKLSPTDLREVYGLIRH